jgi:hypothetical protein
MHLAKFRPLAWVRVLDLEFVTMTAKLFHHLLPLFALMLAAVTPATAQDQVAAFVQAQAQFESALHGDSSALPKASAAFKELLNQEPGNPLFLAYYGSTYALQAREAWMPWNKLKLAEQGLDLIDKGLGRLQPVHDQMTMRGAPISVETRLVAISTFFQVPDNFLHRTDPGKRLLAETLQAPAYAASPPALKARLQFQAAVAARLENRRNDEVASLQRVLALDAGNVDGPAAKARLKELGL